MSTQYLELYLQQLYNVHNSTNFLVNTLPVLFNEKKVKWVYSAIFRKVFFLFILQHCFWTPIRLFDTQPLTSSYFFPLTSNFDIHIERFVIA